jgi:osmotically-inducible protein OsmY
MVKTDLQLQNDIAAELAWDPFVEGTRVGVEVKDGIVTLSGHVESYAQKCAAEHAVERVAGVKGLAVELDVILPGSSKRMDSDIAEAVNSALEWSTSIPGGAIKVMVEDGWVTLSGEVGWAYVRTAASTCVRTLVGVKGVIDKIELRPCAQPHDVKDKIEAALQRRAHLDTKAITVGVESGTVTLSGVVGSWAERETIEHAAWSAPGVHKVVDELVVGS